MSFFLAFLALIITTMDMNKSRSSQGLLRSPTTPPDTPPLPSVSSEGKAKVDKLMDQVRLYFCGN